MPAIRIFAAGKDGTTTARTPEVAAAALTICAAVTEAPRLSALARYGPCCELGPPGNGHRAALAMPKQLLGLRAKGNDAYKDAAVLDADAQLRGREALPSRTGSLMGLPVTKA